jgi:predicted phosphate transport protein (TIGR00153 family)
MDTHLVPGRDETGTAMKIRLTPRTTEFYVLFARAGENALEVARLVERRFKEHPNSGVTQEQVKAVETAGDTLTRDLIQLLNTQYLTPFDRDDIYMLATEIDDVVDYLEEASDLLGLYGVEMPTRHAVEQCAIIVKAVEQLATACDNLKSGTGVQAALVALKGLEDEGDRVLRDALASLFRDERIDPLIVIRWKDIYEALERALDACETAANVIANIIVKNA